jgi:hypothetical protein
MINYKKQCLAFKNKKSIIPCLRKTKNDNFFCGLHKNSKKFCILPHDSEVEHLNKYMSCSNIDNLFRIKQNIATRKIIKMLKNRKKKISNINYLNKHYKHYLINGEDSWFDVPIKYRILFNGECWDIRSLYKCFTQQLNSCDLGNPKPTILHNPFNRIKYNKYVLKYIYNNIKLLKLKINISLRVYFNKLSDNIYNTKHIIYIFNKYLRYKMINYEDSQGNYIGYWVKKNKKISDFENIYNELIEINPFILGFNRLLLINPLYMQFNEILKEIPKEEWIIC